MQEYLKKIQESSKFINMTTEELMEMTNTITGLLKVKKILSTTENGKQIYELLTKYKIREILYEGKVELDDNSSSLYKIVNNEKNYSFLCVLMGEEELKKFFLETKKIYKQIIIKKKLKTGFFIGLLLTCYIILTLSIWFH